VRVLFQAQLHYGVPGWWPKRQDRKPRGRGIQLYSCASMALEDWEARAAGIWAEKHEALLRLVLSEHPGRARTIANIALQVEAVCAPPATLP
jgi:hypothetical protein